MRLAIALVLAATAVGVLAPAALADDNGVYGAYVSRDADFSRLGKQLKKDIKAWVASHHRKPAPALATIKDSRAACSDVIAAMKGEQPSSDNGTKARAHAVASVSDLRKSLGALAGGIRARTARHAAKAKRFAERANVLLKRSLKEEKRARSLFKAAGVAVKS